MARWLAFGALSALCCLDVASFGLFGGPRSVAATEAEGVWGGSVALAAGSPSCAVVPTCTGFVGSCNAGSCVTCPPTTNYTYVTGALAPKPTRPPCPAGTSTGICVRGWTGCYCAPPAFATPCGTYTLTGVFTIAG